MKRALVVAAFLLAPALFAQTSDRSILLASNGTLYTAESDYNDSSSVASTRYITLTIQNGTNVIRTNVPASVSGGNNWQPELAYDDDSSTLFIFWLHSQNTILGMNELLFCTFQNGKWNTASAVDDVPYHFRYNVRVGVTRSVQYTDSNDVTTQIPGLTVHAAWWDDSAAGETARYAMLTVDRGVVADVALHDLTDFTSNANLRQFDLDDKSRESLRHPVVFESPEHDTVDVVFGDMQYNVIHRLTLKPVLQTRVRIPIGIRDTTYPAPKFRSIGSESRLSGISTPPDRLVYYYQLENAVSYMTFENGAWSDEKSISVTSEVSAESAVSALRRMVRGD
ncbi:MAG TPA: hypothetical protein VF505_10610 [Thermoanaerobaculia bacterium]